MVGARCPDFRTWVSTTFRRTTNCSILRTMPAGLERRHERRHLHFITVSCHGRLPYFNIPEARDIFEDALERTRVRYDFWVTAYVVMPEHVHILISEPKRGSLSDAMKMLKLSVALRRPQRPFWLPRYHDFNVFSSEKRLQKLKYIHRNPVKRGLVAEPEEWAWSSFKHYATGICRVVEVENDWTAARRERAAAVPMSEYPDMGHPHS